MIGWLGAVDRAALRRYLLGDLIVIVGFLIAGELHHGIDPMTSPLLVADTLAQFLLGWLVAAPVLGAYARATLDRPAVAAGLAVLSWVAADLLGQLLRSSAAFHGDYSPVFALVIGAGGAVLLTAWRLLADVAATRRE
ncbi:MAG: DUF3054 domain-containing protein [Halobacteriaceae archaeon]